MTTIASPPHVVSPAEALGRIIADNIATGLLQMRDDHTTDGFAIFHTVGVAGTRYKLSVWVKRPEDMSFGYEVAIELDSTPPVDNQVAFQHLVLSWLKQNGLSVHLATVIESEFTFTTPPLPDDAARV